MKPAFIFICGFLCLQSIQANQKDDLAVVDKFLEVYPKIDLTREAIIQTQIIGDKYSQDLANIMTGKIRYVMNQKAQARSSFKKITKSSQYYQKSILEYYETASDERVKDITGVKESSRLFVENKLWEKLLAEDEENRGLVKEILESCISTNSSDRRLVAEVLEIMKSLGMDAATGLENKNLVDDVEKVFLNDWALKPGDIKEKKDLEKLLEKLQDLEFGEKNYDYFTAFSLRARILSMLGREKDALALLDLSREKVSLFDKHLAEVINKDKNVPASEKASLIKRSSVMSQWFYARAITGFSLFRKSLSTEEAAKDFLFGKKGAAVYFYLNAKKFPESEYGMRSIIAYQNIRGIIQKKYQKSLKELEVPSLTQGVAHYQVKNYEEALALLEKAVFDKNDEISYDAYNYAIGAAAELGEWERAEKLFQGMVARHSARNKKPKDYISRLTIYLVAKCLKNSEEKPELLDKAVKVFNLAGQAGKDKSVVSLKFMLTKKLFSLLNQSSEEKQVQAEALALSLENDHRLSVESAKILRYEGLTYHRLNDSEKAIKSLKKYMKEIPRFVNKPDENIIKTGIFLCELMVNKNMLEEVSDYMADFEKLPGVDSNKYKESLDSIKLNILAIKMEQEASLTKAYMERAQAFTEKYKDSPARPYIWARMAAIYQSSEKEVEAQKLYARLQKEYPGHDALEQSEFNHVLSMMKADNFTGALSLLSESDKLDKLNNNSLYAALVQIYNGFNPEEVNSVASKSFLKIISSIESRSKKLDDYKREKLNYIKASCLRKTGEVANALKLLEKLAEDKANSFEIIDIKLEICRCYEALKDFSSILKANSKLQSFIGRTNAGKGNLGLSLKVSATIVELLQDAVDEKHIKRGKGIAFLSSQLNESVLKESDLIYLEQAEYYNAFYSRKLDDGNFNTLKKEFLRKYPYSKFAPLLRKL